MESDAVEPNPIRMHFTEDCAHRLETAAVHAGREDLQTLGVHALPIDLSTTYPVPDLKVGRDSLATLAEGDEEAANPVYSRLHNPTVHRFEQALARLEHTDSAIAFASGMAAMTAVLLAVRTTGKHVIAVRPVYGGTDHLLASGLLDLDVSFVGPDEIAAAVRKDTALVVIETPTNPTLKLHDIEDVVRQAGTVPVLVDSTFATPILQNPIDHGATYVLHSATKFLGGHGDVLAGIVATDETHAKALRQVRILTGAVLHPLAGYLLHRGLQTLPIRVRMAQENACILAERLASHPAVRATMHPSLPGQDPQGIAKRQMRGPGSIIAFEVGSAQTAAKVLASVKLITSAVSLGSTDSLIQHPAGLTHQIVGEAALAEGKITEGLLRLSVGIENVEDLWQDLDRALLRANELEPVQPDRESARPRFSASS